MMTFYAAAGSYQIRSEDGKNMPYQSWRYFLCQSERNGRIRAAIWSAGHHRL